MAERMGGEEYGTDTWVAFEPGQLKSASGNGGRFAPSCDDLMGNVGDSLGAALRSADNNIAGARLSAGYLVGDLFNRL